jgi:hypothetical protein
MAKTGRGFWGRLPVLTHAQSYHYARGGRTTEQNLAPGAVNHPVSIAGENLTTRQGYSHGGSVERNDDGTYDADNANLTELSIALERASQEDVPDNTRADAPLNQAAADLDQVASYRTGQGVRELHYRWGEGAQTAKHPQQPNINDIENQAIQDYDPDQNDQDQQ